jgi:AAA15 family ATPase/GTPase
MKLQEFSFGNFKSFKDIQTLNLSSAKIKSKNPEIDKLNIIKGKNIAETSFLKTKAIYGANASGKSNIIKALVTFIRIIKTSVKDEDILDFLIEPFKLSTETEKEPSFFQMIFWDKNIKYRYGFELNNNNITSEWLYGKPGDREMPFFIREEQEIIELDKTNYSEGHKLMSLLEDDSDDDNDIFRHNSLFLSTLATFGFGKLSKQLVDSIGSISIISGLGHQGMYNYAGDSLKDKK